MKILSWNIWVDCDFEKLKEFLKSADADVIGLQEVKDDDQDRNVIGYLQSLGYEYVFAKTEQEWGGKVYRHGPAIFSKFPIVHSETSLLDEENEKAVAIADINVNGEIVHFFSTHLVHTHQKSSAEQEEQTKKLIEKLPREKAVLMGDFNATPESKSIKMLKNILVDTDKHSSPTWCVHPAGCPVCNKSVIDTRLDYIFVSDDLNTGSFKVETSEASDHLPISLNLNVN